MLRDDALVDLVALQSALENRFAYLKVRSIDHRSLLDRLRVQLPEQVEAQRFGLDIQKLLAHFTDGHAGVNAKPYPAGYLPFLVETAGNRLVALAPDRTRLLDQDSPFLATIDGIEIGTWLRAAEAYTPNGSPQFRQRGSLVWLRALQMLRADLGLPQRTELEVQLTDGSGNSIKELRLEVADKPTQLISWPQAKSRILEGNIGYLRLERMTPEAASESQAWLKKFNSTAALVIDLRGNGGGTRDVLMTLLPLLMPPGSDPLVINLAAYRLHHSHPEDHLAARHLYPVTSEKWTPAERTRLKKFMSNFEPEWQPSPNEFSDWHAMLVSPAKEDNLAGYLDRPVVALSDAKCFSATDVFLSALKQLPNVTIVGEPSGGGSARAQVIDLPKSGLKVRLASMASFQASGLLFDGHGVQPDVVVHAEPEYYLDKGRDTLLEKATELALQHREPA